MKKFFVKSVTILALLSMITGILSACGDAPDTAEVTESTAAPETTVSETEPVTEKEETTVKEISAEDDNVSDFKDGKYYVPNYFVNNPMDEAYSIRWLKDKVVIFMSFDRDAGKSYESDYYFEIKLNEYGEIVSAVRFSTETDESGKETTEQFDMSKEHKIKYDSKHRMIQLDDYDIETGKVSFSNTYKYDGSGIRTGRHWSFSYDKENTADIKYEYEKGQVVKTDYDCAQDIGDRVYVYETEFNKAGLPTTVMEGITYKDSTNEPEFKPAQDYTYSSVTKAQYDFYNNTLRYLLLDSTQDVW